MDSYNPDGGSSYAYSLGKGDGVDEQVHILTSFISEYWYRDYTTGQIETITTINYEILRRDPSLSSFVNDGIDYESEIIVGVPVVTEPVLIRSPTNALYAFVCRPDEAGNYALLYTHKNGGSWSTPVGLSTKAALKCEMSATTDQFGKISLIWNYVNKTDVWLPDLNTTKSMFTGTIYMKTYSPYTQTWSDDAPINTKECYSQYPTSTIDSDGNIYLAYIDVNLTDSSDKRLLFKKGWTDSDEDGLTNNVEVDIENYFYSMELLWIRSEYYD